MKRWLQVGCAALAACLFVFSTSLKQFHYLFSGHRTLVYEHCSNHLHSKGEHTHECPVCHFDKVVFTSDEFVWPEVVSMPFTRLPITGCELYLSRTSFNIPLLRGPPAA